jgi:hypothetical protein
MSLALAATLAASAAALPTCSWDHPGQNPFVGNVVAAVDRYTDIPAPVRAELKKRIAERRYDEIAVIKRDAITGRHSYAPEIREMHFGRGQVCGTVTRAKWSDAAEELGLVYCESGHCILIPTVCRNVSRITRLAERSAAAAESAPAAPAAGEPAAMSMAEAPPDGELIFEPPAAGGTLALAPLSPLAPGGTDLVATGPGGVGGNPGLLPLFPLWPSPPAGPSFRPAPLPSVPLPPIPEPSSALLMLGGLAGLAGLRALRRRRSTKHGSAPGSR